MNLARIDTPAQLIELCRQQVPRQHCPRCNQDQPWAWRQLLTLEFHLVEHQQVCLTCGWIIAVEVKDT